MVQRASKEFVVTNFAYTDRSIAAIAAARAAGRQRQAADFGNRRPFKAFSAQPSRKCRAASPSDLVT
jgi:hypothetical protein